MAKGGGESGLWDIVGVAVVGVVAYFALSSGALDGILKSLTGNLKGLSIPSMPSAGGGGGGGAGGGATAAPGGAQEVVRVVPIKEQERRHQQLKGGPRSGITQVGRLTQLQLRKTLRVLHSRIINL